MASETLAQALLRTDGLGNGHMARPRTPRVNVHSTTPSSVELLPDGLVGLNLTDPIRPNLNIYHDSIKQFEPSWLTAS